MRLTTIPFTLALLALLTSVWAVSPSALETLGFESWEEPTPEELLSQYSVLSQKYSPQSATPCPEKANAVRRAYQEASREGLRDRQPNTHTHRTRQAHTANHRYQHHEAHREPFDLNIDELFESLNMGFQYQRAESNKAQMSSSDFYEWIKRHPQVIFACLLISFGFINLCACCCSFCCHRKEKDRQSRSLQGVHSKKKN